MKAEKRNKLVIVVLVTMAIALTLIDLYNKSVNTFSAEKWETLVDNRGALVDDLIKSHLLIGVDRHEAIAILGDPTASEDKGKPVILEAETMKYKLGDKNLVGIPSYLCVDLEKDKVVLVYKYHAVN